MILYFIFDAVLS